MDGLWFSPANRKPQFGVIALHGLGATSDNLAPFAAALASQLTEDPHTTATDSYTNDIQQALDECQIPMTCVLPQAPTRPVSIANGMSLPAWFDVYSLGRDAKEDREGLGLAHQLIDAVIAELNQQGIHDQHIFIGGFSQGGMVALHSLCCEPNRFAGVFALSSCLLRDEVVPTGGDTPVFLSHGAQDEVIPLQYGKETHSRLSERGFRTVWHIQDTLPHAIDHQTITQLAQWMHPRMLARQAHTPIAP